MAASVTAVAASAAPHRRLAVAVGMLMVLRRSHAPATAATSTISNRSLNPLLFRAIAGWRGVPRST